MVGEILQHSIRVRQEHAVRRRRRVVHEADRALDDVELADRDQHAGLVADLLGGGRGLSGPLPLGGVGPGGVHVVHVDAFGRRVLQLDRLHFSSIFGGAAGRQHALVDPQVKAIRDGLEIVELDVREVDVAAKRGMGLRHEVRLAVDGDTARFEDHGRQADLGWIDPVPRPHVADVRGHEVEVAKAQRLERPRVDVGHVAAAHLEVVDLQGVDRLQRLLPSALLDRGRVVDLLSRLLEIDVDRGLLDLDVGDEAAAQKRSPVDAGAQALDVKDCRVGVCVLGDLHVFQVERQAQRVEIERRNARGVPLERSVHLRLGIPSQRLVDHGRDAIGDHQDDRERHGDGEPVAPNASVPRLPHGAAFPSGHGSVEQARGMPFPAEQKSSGSRQSFSVRVTRRLDTAPGAEADGRSELRENARVFLASAAPDDLGTALAWRLRGVRSGPRGPSLRTGRIQNKRPARRDSGRIA